MRCIECRKNQRTDPYERCLYCESTHQPLCECKIRKCLLNHDKCTVCIHRDSIRCKSCNKPNLTRPKKEFCYRCI